MRFLTALQTHPAAKTWKLRIEAVVWSALGLAFLLSIPIVLDMATWAPLVPLVLGALLAAPTAWVGRRFSGSGSRRTFGQRWRSATVAWFFLLCVFVAAPVYYLAVATETRPALAPQATLVNGDKTVVFQGMQHIGSDHFYKSVIYDVERALAEGYVVYYESVQTATPESKEFFEKLTAALVGGQRDLARTYRTLGDLCGLRFQQDYFDLLEADQREHPERHVIADVDALELKEEYERLLRTDPAFAEAHADGFAPSSTPEQSLSGAVEFLKSGTEDQKKLAAVVCRGVMTLAFEAEPKDDAPAKRFGPIIIDFRNRALAKRIIEEPRKRIFVTYGKKHLPGVLELLREHDPGWTVASVKWLRTIETEKRNLRGDPRDIVGM